MYSSRGGNGYGQDQPYSSQSSYVPQTLGAAALLSGGVHGHPSAAGVAPPPQHYGVEYSSVYGSSTQQQMTPLGMKGSEIIALEGRSYHGSSMQESHKFTANDYVTSSSRGYGQKVDQLYPGWTHEYPSVERRQYVDQAYLARDLPSETTNRYAESLIFGHEHQSKLYDRLEPTTVLRQEEMRKAHVLQSASVEGGARQAEYLAARSGVRHPAQNPIAYGAPPPRNRYDLIYAQGSSTPGYGVSLPPGRDYGVAKGLHGTTLELDYSNSILGRVGHLTVDDRKDDRAIYSRELERRDKERDYLREQEKHREREKDRLRERERERDRERERERDRERERVRREKEKEPAHKRKLELKREPTPPRVSRDRRASSLIKDIRSLRRESPRHSPVRGRRREYSCKVLSFSFVEAERDFLSLDKRYSRLYVSPEFSKVVVYWPRKKLPLSLHTPVILMCGLGQSALANLSSERTYNNRIPHFGNLFRFGVLKKGSALMAIGGPWNTVDGGDPSVDDSSLVRTAMRYAKHIANLDLKNCQHWNRFLEIHYDRVGKDGLFSHKEVTVLYVPDLSECLPSLESWREQWLNHKKSLSERGRLRILTKEVPGDKKEGSKEKKNVEHTKDPKVKTEVKNDSIENASTEQNDETVKVDAEGSNIVSEVVEQQLDGASSNSPAMKTFVCKRVVKKPVNAEKDESSVLEVKADREAAEFAADEEKVKSKDSNAVVVQEGSTKTTVKKKIIKRVLKKKAPSAGKVAEDELNEEKIIHSENLEGQNKEVEMNEVKKEEVDAGKEELSGSAMEIDDANQTQNDSHAKSKEPKEPKDEREGKDHAESGSKSKTNKTANEKKRSNEPQTAKEKNISAEPQVAKEKKRSDEPPKHPGLILQTKGSKVSKLQSLSYSLDSLLGYSDKDIEESTFELSVFAESFFEMLQYEMGCRLLVFLQILRAKFVAKRIKGKRQREETSQKENEESPSKKSANSSNTNEDVKSSRPENKPDNTSENMVSTKTEDHNDALQDDAKTIKEETASIEQVEMSEIEDDPEEDPEEDEQMLEANPYHATPQEENIDAEKDGQENIDADISPIKQSEKEGAVKQTPEIINSSKEKSHKLECKSKETSPRVVNKELLQAFRFFYRNRVGYIKVEDMRLILHNLGKFLSNRDVKELVQSALLESNTGRDDRILYKKLVTMLDLQK